MPKRSLLVPLYSADATCAFAKALGARLGPSDVLLFEGDIGTGKTHFARCLIQSLLTVPEDVPSPTFTLVQTYEARDFEVWHADLYRLTSPDEVVELGLNDAFEQALCLVEWPDRLAELAPDTALNLALSLGKTEGERALHLSWSASKWDSRINEALND